LPAKAKPPARMERKADGSSDLFNSNDQKIAEPPEIVCKDQIGLLGEEFMKKTRGKKPSFASKKGLIAAVLPLSAFVLSILFFPSNASAWWSTGAIESVHQQISNKAFDLISERLVEKPFLTTYRNSIVGYTTSATNDTNAHGGDSARNGGNIAQWFNAFRTAHNENRLDDAAEYLGYCLHLLISS
jgi:hypothetical protein